MKSDSFLRLPTVDDVLAALGEDDHDVDTIITRTLELVVELNRAPSDIKVGDRLRMKDGSVVVISDHDGLRWALGMGDKIAEVIKP